MNFFQRLFGKKEEVTSLPIVDSPTAADWESRIAEALNILKPHVRKTYIPVVAENGKQFSAQSKMGGYPYLRNEQDWPVCPNCSKHMQLFVQLNREEFPEKKSHGLVQLFYCTNSEPHCESQLDSYDPFSDGSVRRIIEISGESATIEPNMGEVFDEKQIVGWEAQDDYPHWEEYYDLGIELDDDVSDELHEREIGIPVEGDKLFGWPAWVQGVEYPESSEGEAFELLFQIDSEDNLPYMFGDMGTGHLTQSKTDEQSMGFGWACY